MRRGFQKYGAKKTYCAAKHFHPSKGEAMRCDCLHLYQAAGRISNLKVNKPVNIVEGMRYKADFVYTENGELIVEDFKGVITQRFRDIMRLWKFHGVGLLRVSKIRGAFFYVEKEIKGGKEPD